MKFCPQCGTPFEINARFCLECGFDRSTVEPVEPAISIEPEVSAEEIKTVPSASTGIKMSQPEAKPGCPQCGSMLDPAERFCKECGFDTTIPAIARQEVAQPHPLPAAEEITASPEPVKESGLPEVNGLFCPQCGSGIEADERFCQECGFDTINSEIIEPETPEPLPIPETAEEFTQPVSLKEPLSPEVSTAFCTQCGTGITADERFCQECGYDTAAEKVPVNKTFEPVEQPAEIHRPEPGYIPPAVENVPPPIAVQKPETVLPPPPPPLREEPPAFVPPIRATEPFVKQKNKKPWLRIVLIIFGLGVLGAAGWFGYNAYLGNQESTTSDTISDMALPPISETDTNTTSTEVMDLPEETAPEQPETSTKPLSKVDQELARQRAKSKAKPLSKIDQELARQKTKEQNKPAQQTASPVQNAKTDPNANDNLATVLLEVGRKEDPKNKNPKNPTKLVLQNSTMIVRITTDHYNDGMGTSGGGTIMIKDRDNNIIASLRAYGKTGKDGTPGAKWVCEPHKVLEKGTYYIQDSDAKTWSKTFLGAGFVVVEGYEVE